MSNRCFVLHHHRDLILELIAAFLPTISNAGEDKPACGCRGQVAVREDDTLYSIKGCKSRSRSSGGGGGGGRKIGRWLRLLRGWDQTTMRRKRHCRPPPDPKWAAEERLGTGASPQVSPPVFQAGKIDNQKRTVSACMRCTSKGTRPRPDGSKHRATRVRQRRTRWGSMSGGRRVAGDAGCGVPVRGRIRRELDSAVLAERGVISLMSLPSAPTGGSASSSAAAADDAWIDVARERGTGAAGDAQSGERRRRGGLLHIPGRGGRGRGRGRGGAKGQPARRNPAGTRPRPSQFSLSDLVSIALDGGSGGGGSGSGREAASVGFTHVASNPAIGTSDPLAHIPPRLRHRHTQHMNNTGTTAAAGPSSALTATTTTTASPSPSPSPVPAPSHSTLDDFPSLRTLRAVAAAATSPPSHQLKRTTTSTPTPVHASRSVTRRTRFTVSTATAIVTAAAAAAPFRAVLRSGTSASANASARASATTAGLRGKGKGKSAVWATMATEAQHRGGGGGRDLRGARKKKPSKAKRAVLAYRATLRVTRAARLAVLAVAVAEVAAPDGPAQAERESERSTLQSSVAVVPRDGDEKEWVDVDVDVGVAADVETPEEPGRHTQGGQPASASTVTLPISHVSFTDLLDAPEFVPTADPPAPLPLPLTHSPPPPLPLQPPLPLPLPISTSPLYTHRALDLDDVPEFVPGAWADSVVVGALELEQEGEQGQEGEGEFVPVGSWADWVEDGAGGEVGGDVPHEEEREREQQGGEGSVRRGRAGRRRSKKGAKGEQEHEGTAQAKLRNDAEETRGEVQSNGRPQVWDGTNTALRGPARASGPLVSAVEHVEPVDDVEDGQDTPETAVEAPSPFAPRRKRHGRGKKRVRDESIDRGVKVALERDEGRIAPAGPGRYVTQIASEELDSSVSALLTKLAQFQLRQVQTNPTKAKSRRRLILGLRETTRHLRRGKPMKCVIVARNVEEALGDASPKTLLSELLDLCHSRTIPVVFAMTRRQLSTVARSNHRIAFAAVAVASSDGADEDLRTVLRHADHAADVWRVQFAKAQDSSCNKHNARGETPVWIAAREGYRDPRIVEACVANGWGLETADALLGYTPLLAAAVFGNGVVMGTLLRMEKPRVNLSAVSKEGETAALVLSASGRSEMLQALLTRAVEYDAMSGNSLSSGVTARLLTAGNFEGTTPLHSASRIPSADVVNVLLSFADKCRIALDGTRFDGRGGTAITYCCEVGSYEILRRLIERAPRPLGWSHVAFSGEVACSPVIMASKSGHLSLIRLLCRASSMELFQPPASKRTTPMKRREKREKPFKPDLAAVATMLNARDGKGKTALWWAAHNGYLDIVKELVWRGADCNIPDEGGESPLDVVGRGVSNELERGSAQLHVILEAPEEEVSHSSESEESDVGEFNPQSNLTTSKGLNGTIQSDEPGKIALIKEFLKSCSERESS
ncbi:hypothetical protein M427DRAFT_495762 [Gonapodya prolifera JEL478]|uniref:Ribosomal protein eL8/eL30/eS12/Gadd45 domain-containing protein n=1 Tax=Gonapodya prolifera (strain JEL478) TaxID=1344416 RepID=A0A139AH55_GONPJ|nr:hypothetical protein M427DRAFT_495762 [Gonapodya prolifera JEL478]|eukprot:KXS16090.1 hypothetical protein M427DRAFT_495762 [Gonapodya prolifera JEL478]